MTVIRCTARLLGLVAGSPVTRSLEPAQSDWYANLLWIGGRKSLLVAHAGTLFALWEPEVRKADLSPLGPFAIELIRRELVAEHLPLHTFGELDPAKVVVGRTCNRHVLGTMNDMRYHVEAVVQRAGGVAQVDLSALNRALRRILFSAIGYDRAIDRTRALLNSVGESAATNNRPQAQDEDRIDSILDAFLAQRRATLSARQMPAYEAIVGFLKLHLNRYAYQGLSELERQRWERTFNAGEEDAYTKLFGAEKIPEETAAFVGHFMIAKVIAPRTVTSAAGRVMAELLDWLLASGLLTTGQVAEAQRRAISAALDLPKAERLASLLYEASQQRTLDVETLADSDYIEDHLTISRVEPAALWFEGVDGDIGPLPVTAAISRLARPGWSVNVVMGRAGGHWHVLEVGNVYPN